MDNSKPLPEITPETAPYWEAARQRKLMIQKCRDCGRHQHYARLICRYCHGTNVEWVESSGQGQVYSFSVVYRSPGPFAQEVPYTTAVVELAEGARIYSRIVGFPPEKVVIGMPVKVDYVKASDTITLPVFREA